MILEERNKNPYDGMELKCNKTGLICKISLGKITGLVGEITSQKPVEGLISKHGDVNYN